MATAAVYNYMKTQNRPYTVNDIVTNLHNEYNKIAVQKAMDQLVADGKLFAKVNKIYSSYKNRILNINAILILSLGLWQTEDILRCPRFNIRH